MYIPIATYRIQFSASFTFKDLEEIISYLGRLGISTIYASPVFKARSGSTHGYDVTDAHAINEEIGTPDEFRSIVVTLKDRGIGWLQDIVPNHMAYSGENKWLMDVLEKGPFSKYYTWFDINWHFPEKKYEGKLMAPFLGGKLDDIIGKNEIKLEVKAGQVRFRYYEHEFPLAFSTYFPVLEKGLTYLKKESGKTSTAYQQYTELVEAAGRFRHDLFNEQEWAVFKKMLEENLQNSEVVKAIKSALQYCNEETLMLKQLLGQQFFHLTHWKKTERKINYRRFFTINDLICLRMEDDKVFEDYHSFIKTLYDEGLIQGLRIDHIDGLFDPEKYLFQLRRLAGSACYLIIEKILEWDERLPEDWPVQGTSGYYYIAALNALFTDQKNREAFSEFYKKLLPDMPEYQELAYEKKLFILLEQMGGELDNLIYLSEALALIPSEIKGEKKQLRKALSVLLACFPVYRVYTNKFPLSRQAHDILNNAFEKAVQKAPDLDVFFDHLADIFTERPTDTAEEKSNKLFFLMRCQQLTGPLAAKGLEDTAFYVYNRLISHNEVGNSPEVFGIATETFHERMKHRCGCFPHSINATATHDTKRGEDVRTCLNALSEMPEEWQQQVKQWIRINKKHKQPGAKVIPADNDEYFFYQTLIGVVPMDGKIDPVLAGRLKQYMIKAVREGKVNSNWGKPDENYEAGLQEFIEAVLNDRPFLKTFLPFMQKVSFYGALYSLGQVLLKVTTPGVPDVYQGCELWDLTMVDPDNRQNVDYQKRIQYLDEIQQNETHKIITLIRDLRRNLSDGRIKLFTLYKALNERKKKHELFAHGDYIPLNFTGEKAEHAIGFIRKYKQDWSIIIVPQLLVSLVEEGIYPLDEAIWQGTKTELPEEAPDKWKDIFTGEVMETNKELQLSAAFSHFPVCFLSGEK